MKKNKLCPMAFLAIGHQFIGCLSQKENLNHRFKARDGTQLIKYLLSMYKVQSSSPSNTEQK